MKLKSMITGHGNTRYMALKIKPTPKLNREDSVKFIERVERNISVASHPISTPKLIRFIKKLMKDASQEYGT